MKNSLIAILLSILCLNISAASSESKQAFENSESAQTPAIEQELNNDSFTFHYLDDMLKKSCVNGVIPIFSMTPSLIKNSVKNLVNSLIGSHGKSLNWSIGKIDKDSYLLAVRVTALNTFRVANLPDKKIIPGNRAESQFEKGQNFWWMDWDSTIYEGGTLYFRWYPNYDACILLLPTNGNLEVANGCDIRIMKDNNDLFIYNPRASTLAYKITNIEGDPQSATGTITFEPVIASRAHGNNWGMVKMNQDHALYMDWFYQDGIKSTKVPSDQKLPVETKTLPYKNSALPIIGEGSYKGENNAKRNSGIMPLFSFGTPHVKIGDLYIGVGHTKIHTDAQKYPYKAHSRIENFRNNIYQDFTTKFGTKYVRHDAYFSRSDNSKGYTYLMYFYTFQMDQSDNIYNMKISDSFLPILLSDAENDNRYIFSMIFPMGITEAYERNNLYVSAGYGDFASVLLKFNTQLVIDLCTHDAQNLNMNDYQYKLLVKKADGSVHFMDRLIDTEPNRLTAGALNALETKTTEHASKKTGKTQGKISPNALTKALKAYRASHSAQEWQVLGETITQH